MYRYRFRVKAVNKLGQSLPCDMKGGAIVIKVNMMATMAMMIMHIEVIKVKMMATMTMMIMHIEAVLLVKGHGWLRLLQKSGNLFPFWVLFIPSITRSYLDPSRGKCHA